MPSTIGAFGKQHQCDQPGCRVQDPCVNYNDKDWHKETAPCLDESSSLSSRCDMLETLDLTMLSYKYMET
jgi:hypothetical protein